MDASLRLDVVVEHHDGVSIVVGYLFAVFFIEWRLIIHTGGKSHRESLVERRHKPHACARTHEELLVVVPVGAAHTAVYHPQSHPALHLVGVLGKEREAVRRQIVARRHIIYYIHTGAIDRERIACRVAHLPLALAVVDAFVHEIDAVGEVVEVYRGVSSHSEVENTHFQSCAGMFVIFSHTELTADGVFAVGSGFVEPIFARDVVCHEFVGEVSRCKEREIARFVVPVIEGEGAEIGLEFVFFLSVEIHGELLGIVGCAETGAAVLGGETVVVHRDIAEESHLHLLAKAQVEVGLIVEILRVIFPLGLEGAEQRTVALVANAMELREVAGVLSKRGVHPLERQCQCPLVFLRLAIGDVEHRRHSVAIFGIESACREVYRAYHIRVDNAQPLLLSAADELRAIYFYSVDIHAVFVIRASAHHILRTHLVL